MSRPRLVIVLDIPEELAELSAVPPAALALIGRMLAPLGNIVSLSMADPEGAAPASAIARAMLVPRAPPVQGKRKRRRGAWSRERLAYLAEAYPAGVPYAVMLEAINPPASAGPNPLAGPKITHKQLASKASSSPQTGGLGLKRPSFAAGVAAGYSAGQVAPADLAGGYVFKPLPAGAMRGAVVVSWPEADAWARKYAKPAAAIANLRLRENAINHARLAFQLPLLAIKARAGRYELGAPAAGWRV